MLPQADTLEDGYSYAPNSHVVRTWRDKLKAHGYKVWMISDQGRGVFCITVCLPGTHGYYVFAQNQVDYLLSHDAPSWN